VVLGWVVSQREERKTGSPCSSFLRQNGKKIYVGKAQDRGSPQINSRRGTSSVGKHMKKQIGTEVILEKDGGRHYVIHIAPEGKSGFDFEPLAAPFFRCQKTERMEWGRVYNGLGRRNERRRLCPKLIRSRGEATPSMLRKEVEGESAGKTVG